MLDYSLLINVQFRGDFGIMTDEAMRHMGAGGSGSHSAAGSSAKSRGTSAHGHGHGTVAGGVGLEEIGGSSHSMGDLFEVPLGDLSLLVSPPVGGYGTRLHNLHMKIDLKEV